MEIVAEPNPWQKLISKETLLRWPDSIVLVDAKALQSLSHPPERCIAVVDKKEPQDLVDLSMVLGVRHVVQTSHPKLDHAVNLAASLIADPDLFLDAPAKTYFTHRYPQPSTFNSMEFKVQNSKEKAATLQEISKYLEANEKTRTACEAVLMVADELYTNAIFNAPVDEKGVQKFSKLPRNLPVVLDPGFQAKMTVAFDDHVLLLLCEDSYGSLVSESMIERISNCYKVGARASINMGDGGAGIGCYLVMEQSNSLIVTVRPGRKTVIGVAILIGLPKKLIATIPKNLHWL